MLFFDENVRYILFPESPLPFSPASLPSVLLQEQVFASRYGGWIRTSLWRIVSEGWDFEITYTGRVNDNTGNSHFNPHVEDLPRGYTWGYIHIFTIFLFAPVYQWIMPPKLSNPLIFVDLCDCKQLLTSSREQTDHCRMELSCETILFMTISICLPWFTVW